MRSSLRNNINDCVKDANAIIILTEWEEFSCVDWDLISKKMIKPAWVFDTRGISNIFDIKKSGLNVWYLGVGVD